MDPAAPVILIPSHSLEDFPTDCEEAEAEGLLAAFSACYDPVFLAGIGKLPIWERADLPSEDFTGRRFIIPAVSEKSLPSNWKKRAQEDGATLICGVQTREELVVALRESVFTNDSNGSESRFEISGEEPIQLAGDLLALGTARLLVELLARHMHYFSDFQEEHFESLVVAAAKELLDGQHEECHRKILRCFELLLEGRERFYSIDSYLVDLCLLLPDQGRDALLQRVRKQVPVSCMASAKDWETLLASDAELSQVFKDAVREDRVDFVGVEYEERCSPLLPLQSWLYDFQRGLKSLNNLFQHPKLVWGRRRFGLSTTLPQLIARNGVEAAMHLAFDDGVLPDDEQSRFEWEGCDGSVINCISRIPLAGDSSLSFLKLPQRLSETMNHDHLAMLAFAHWPEMKTPWLDDLFRATRYQPVFGQFVRLSEYLSSTEHTGYQNHYEQNGYRTPFLSQFVARREQNPITRFRDFWTRSLKTRAMTILKSIPSLLAPIISSDSSFNLAEFQHEVESSHPDVKEAEPGEIDAKVEAALRQAASELAGLVTGVEVNEVGKTTTQGTTLAINPFAFERTAIIEAESEPAKLVTIPACGFAVVEPYIPKASSKKEPPMAEANTLRNEFFEVTVSETTGGIQRIKNYGRSPNRLSQQLAFRFRDPVHYTAGNDTDDEAQQTHYTHMHLDHLEVMEAGPLIGRIKSTGRLFHPEEMSVIADFQQIYTVRRGVKRIDIDIELTPHHQPKGSPWQTYYASRFAWNSSIASVSGSLQRAPFPLGKERIEAMEYIEIYDDQLFTTIIPHGLPFHVRQGDRMLDTLLAVEGETETSFRLSIAVDESHPIRGMLDAVQPPLLIDVPQAPSVPKGWFFQLGTRNLQLERLLPNHLERAESSSDFWILEIVECESRHVATHIRCPKPPKSATQIDFQGQEIVNLKVTDDKIAFESGPSELQWIRVEF